MKKAKVTVKSSTHSFAVDTHDLRGRTVTIVDVLKGPKLLGRGVSIRNPKDCPIPSDGVKFALQRALKVGKVGKVARTKLWKGFFAAYPVKPTGLILDEFLDAPIGWAGIGEIGRWYPALSKPFVYGAAGQGKSASAARIFSGNKWKDRAGVKFKTPRNWIKGARVK